ncbi:MAG: 7-cyano-7-deazaguanine synthase [Nitrospinae bacterium]|nr:7-cyano-7-deazaguanine synthase [Nitrospinota bacterium]
MNSNHGLARIKEKRIEVIEAGRRSRQDSIVLDLERDVKFSTDPLEAYALARSELIIHDAMVVAAAIEYGDKAIKRSSQNWARQISLSIPVHDPDHWNTSRISKSLREATEFLTGDYWEIRFVKRLNHALIPPQEYLNFPVETEAVLPYSDGMDSRAVAGIERASLGEKLVPVRVGTENRNSRTNNGGRKPFTKVPYKVSCHIPNKESSVRSRGFKFALISAIAAYLVDAQKIIIPESGQGIIGPVLVGSGDVYPDYRNHPRFTIRMERFINALLSKQVRYIFPRIWSTKGETLKKFNSLCSEDDWKSTRSCWRDNRWSSVNGKWRHCGVCAACMLRRVAVHAAGLSEHPDAYICTNMSAATLEDAVDPDFTNLNCSYRDYAIAGVLHMDHLAAIANEDARTQVERHATFLAPALDRPREEILECLRTLLLKHATEWQNYLDSLGPNSIVKKWARG